MAVQRETSGSTRGRHRRQRSRAMLVRSSLMAVVIAGGVGAAAFAGGGPSSGQGCATTRTVVVAAAPEVVPAVEQVARTAASTRCLDVEVSAAEAVDVVAGLRRGDAGADVWIPDSSVWASVLPGGSTAGLRSIARTPVVLAVDGRDARWAGATSFEGIARVGATSRVTLLAATPSRSATAQAALVQLGADLSGSPTGRGYLAVLLRSLQIGLHDQDAADLSAPESSRRGPTARVTTERAVWAANQGAGGGQMRAIYPSGEALSLDYPYLVLASDPTTRQAAERLFGALAGTGSVAFDQLGFRPPLTGANPLLTPSAGVDPGAAITTHPLTRSASRAAQRALALLDRPSRTLALVDVSGSMAQAVPGTRTTTRIELARTAMSEALSLFPTGTVAGLWRFSSDLTPTTNYEQLLPLAPLTPASRDAFAAAVGEVQVEPSGGTGLYDSVLAAVRHVREGHDPTRVNSVVVLSDGRNEYAGSHGVTLPALLQALRAESDPRRPVVVISIAYGPNSDRAAMRAISAATGGILYTAKDPRDLPVIFREAIGQRLCVSGC